MFGSVEDEPEHLEISLGGPSISLATPGTISGSAMVSIVEEVEEIESNGESEVSEKSPTGTNLSVAISDGGQSELEEDSSEEFVLDLIPEEEDVFELGETVSEHTEVVQADMTEANDALSQLLSSLFETDILLTQDDIFAGLTSSVTGQSLQEVLNTIEIEEVKNDDDLSKLSKEMRMVLEELFTEL